MTTTTKQSAPRTTHDAGVAAGSQHARVRHLGVSTARISQPQTMPCGHQPLQERGAAPPGAWRSVQERLTRHGLAHICMHVHVGSVAVFAQRREPRYSGAARPRQNSRPGAGWGDGVVRVCAGRPSHPGRAGGGRWCIWIPAVIPDELVSRLDVSGGEEHRAPACRAHHGPVGGEPTIVKAGGLKGVAGTDGGFGRLAGRHMQRQLGALPS